MILGNWRETKWKIGEGVMRLVTEGEETALVATTNLLLIRRGCVHPRGKAHGARRRSRRKALAVATKTAPLKGPLVINVFPVSKENYLCGSANCISCLLVVVRSSSALLILSR